MEKEVIVYTKKIYSSFFYWKNTLKVKRYSDYDIFDLSRKIEEIVIKIIKNNNQYLLSDDLILFIAFRGFCNLKYVDGFLKQFEELANLDYKSGIDLVCRYDDRVSYGALVTSFEGYYEYLRTMKRSNKDIFVKIIDFLKSLEEKSLNENDYEKLKPLVIRVAAYCVIRDDSSLLDKVFEKYFNDISNTIERFKLYGIITDDSNSKVDFIDFVNLDLDNKEQGVIIK